MSPAETPANHKFPGLLPMQTAGVYELDITDDLSTGIKGRRFLYGGAALAVSVMAMEASAGRHCLRAMVQFARPPATGSRLRLHTATALLGRHLSQMTLRACSENDEVFLGNGTMAGPGMAQPGTPDIQRAIWPDVPPPADCPVITAHADADEDVHSLFEIRLAAGRFGIFSRDPASEDGHVLVWCRPLRALPLAAQLALAADFLPSTSSDAVNERAGGRSLDNTLRIVRRVETEWMLCDYHIHSVSGGLGHGCSIIYGADGTLIGVGEQTFAIRMMPRG